MKRYTKPSVSVIEIESNSIMAASITISDDGLSGSVTLSNDNATGDAMSKNNYLGIWDLDDEED
jgi:hypothetical protein